MRGRVRVPGDKSISHRAVILGALAEGTTHLNGLLEATDVLATIAAFRDMGVTFTRAQAGQLTINGTGLRGLKAPSRPLDMGNSGTAMRLLAGVLAAQRFDSELTGDASLRRRPMARVTTPLQQMGAEITLAEGGCPPLRIAGGCRLHAINYEMPIASAQVKSALLLAGLYATGTTSVAEPAPTRDHTERMLSAFGYAVNRKNTAVNLQGGGRLKATELAIPADLSSAAFFVVAAAITPGSDLILENVGVNPTRTGALTLLGQMGAQIDVTNHREIDGEPRGDLRVTGGRLRGITIAEDAVSLSIDEFPILFVAAACAEGETVLRGAAELRIKESDRIAVMAQGLRRLGVDARDTTDGIVIRGGALTGGEVDSHGDHRAAMAFAIAGLRAGSAVTVRDCANVETSFPGFVGLAREAGVAIEVVRDGDGG